MTSLKRWYLSWDGAYKRSRVKLPGKATTGEKSQDVNELVWLQNDMRQEKWACIASHTRSSSSSQRVCVFFLTEMEATDKKVAVWWDLYFRFWKGNGYDWSVKSKEKMWIKVRPEVEMRSDSCRGALNFWTFILRATGKPQKCFK